jgi:tetratricopeptide (TPR) repeat protein
MTATVPSPVPAPAERPSGWMLALVALLTVACLLSPYLLTKPAVAGQSVGNELVFDGRELITRHEVLSAVPEAPGRLFETLTTPWWGAVNPEQKLYRPLSSFTLGLAGVVAGERYDVDRPAGAAVPYKLFAVALKVICALLLTELAARLLGGARRGLIAGLLFATLPLHGEVLFDVAGVAELLCAALSLAACSAWLAAGPQPLSRPAALAGCLALLFAAVHAKESAYALPLVFLALDAGRAGRGGFGAGLRHALSKWPALLACGLVLAVALALRFAVLGGLTPELPAENTIDNPLLGVDAPTRVANALRILACGLPIALGLNPLSSNGSFNADYSLAQVQALAPTAWPNLLGAGALLALLVLAVVLFARCRTRASLVFAYFLALLPVANLLLPIGTVFAERLLFFPSALLVLFLTPFLGRGGNLGLVVALVVSLGNGYWTYSRAADWHSNADLWRHTATHTAQDSARAAYNLGVVYAQRQIPSLAEQNFEAALERAPHFDEARLALAGARLLTYAYEEALVPLRELVERRIARDGGQYRPEAPTERISLTALLHQITTIDALNPGLDGERHLAWLDGLLADGYHSPLVHLYRGETLRALGRVEEAEQAFERALALDPLPVVVDTYARFLELQGRDAEAQAIYERRLAQQVESDSPEALAEFRLQTAQLEFRGDPARALGQVEELLATGELTDRQRARALLLRGQARLSTTSAQDRVAEARAMAQTAQDLQLGLALWPERSEQSYSAIYTLVNLLQLQGREQEAERLLVEALAYLPGAVLHLRLAECLFRQGEHQRAADSYRQAVEGLRDEAGAPVDDGLYIQARVGQLQNLRLSGLADADLRIAALLAEEGARSDLAAAAVRSYAAAIQSDWAALETALVDLEARRGTSAPGLVERLREYRQVSEELLRSANDVRLLTRAAELALALQNAPRASAAIGRALELTPDGAADERAFRLGLRSRVQEALGEIDGAIASVDEALALPGVVPQGVAALRLQRDYLVALRGD